MAIKRLDHASVVVDDLDGAIAFFVELGMQVEGQALVEGEWVDRVNALDGVRADIAMLKTPDGHNRLEVTRFRAPDVVSPDPRDALGNAYGLRSVMFVVDDVEETVASLKTHGGELIGTIEPYHGDLRICYVRGPAGIIVALAEDAS
jgi:catechol 2,3-dioxygenase-like lactoylglutathione lyase family enzyme